MYRTPYTVGELTPYATDTGCDISMPEGSPIIAICDGTVIYAEGWGGKGRAHTKWVKSRKHPRDTPGCLLLRLDAPVIWKAESYPWAFYAHLSVGFKLIRDGIDAPVRVKKGMMIGRSGVGNDSPHEHFTLTQHRDQGPGDTMPPFETAEWIRLYTSQRAG